MKKQAGFTLIEIMIALLIGLIIVGATISIYIATVGSSSSTINSARLNHDLESVMTLMLNDIKRSGYWSGATVDADSRNNPFTAASTNIQISNKTGEAAQSCILYSYDANGNGAVDLNEYYGFRLDSGSIDIRKAVTDITATTCDDVTWEEFIDGNKLTITALQFSFLPIAAASPFPALPATSRCLNVTTNTVTNAAACATDSTNCTAGTPCNIAEKRVINIQISGLLTSDSTVTKTLSGTVEVRNSRLLTQP
ncbi:MAG: prepilin-type N-terminal cleavage/methylation domain-containing protein [Methylococcales bacterium]|nr:prepilin-type N-terminal cleavage/methylation domain-containing protein [Methylococcales bacterium]